MLFRVYSYRTGVGGRSVFHDPRRGSRSSTCDVFSGPSSFSSTNSCYSLLHKSL